jgi:hypothetical protein
MRVREYYGYGLIAGISVTEARHMLPGWILDCYKLRAEYDARLMGAKIQRRMGLL